MVATVCVGAFMGQLDSSIVVIALPSIQRHFHTDLGAVEWVPLAYLLTLVALVTAVGRFADMVGHKLLYIYGFAVFIVGSALCGLAPSLPLLAGFRVLQGLGAAALQANSVALVVQSMPRGKVARGLGVQGAAQALGLCVGPALGGLLLVLGGWRWIFFVTVPAGLIGLGLGWFLLPRSRELSERQPMDWPGIGLFFLATTGLLVALSFGVELGWSSPAIVGCLLLALLAGLGFVVWEARAAAPLMRLSLFRRRAFGIGIGTGLLAFLSLFGCLFAFTFLLEAGQGLSPALAGLRLLLLPLALGITAPLVGVWADRHGARLPTVCGMALTALALLSAGLFPTAGALQALELAAAGVGLGAFTPANNAAIMGSVPRRQAGVASGILNMTRGLGTAAGVTLTGLVFDLGAGGYATHAARPLAAVSGFRWAAFFLAATALAVSAISLLWGDSARRRRSGKGPGKRLSAE